MQVEILDTAVIDFINDIKTKYEQHIEELKNNYETRLKELSDYQYKYLEIKEQYDLLVYKRFARSAEELLADEKQPPLFAEEVEQAEVQEETKQELETIKSFTRKKGGRKPLSVHLERRPRIIDIAESEKTCACGAVLTKIGEEISERLIIKPPQIYVDQIVRPKYACRQCEGTEDEEKPVVRIAPVEPSIIPRSIASPSALAIIFTQKFEMHLPYYRQEKQFEHIGVVISRQDMSNWQQQVYQTLFPLFTLMKKTVKSGPVMQMDETTVQVIGEENRSDIQKSECGWLVVVLPVKRYCGMNTIRLAPPVMQRNFWKGITGICKRTGIKGIPAR